MPHFGNYRKTPQFSFRTPCTKIKVMEYYVNIEGMPFNKV